MAVPINIPTGRVVGQFVMGVVDGDGPNAKPQFIPARGAIDFTSSPPYVPTNTGTADPVTVLQTTTTAILDAEGYICTPSAMNPEIPGRRGLPLMATDSKGSSVEGWTWTVRARFVDEDGAGLPATIPDFNFALPTNAVIDLTSVVKVPSSPGIGKEAAEAAATQAATSARLATAEATAAKAVAKSVEDRANAGEFIGKQGLPGPNTVPTQQAVISYISTPGNPVNTELVREVGKQVAKLPTYSSVAAAEAAYGAGDFGLGSLIIIDTGA